MLNDILTSPYWGAGGVLLGTLIAYVFYRMDRKFKRLSFDIKSFELISNTVGTLPGFEAKFNGEPITTLTTSKILIWNSGREIINASDISAANPVQIILPNKAGVLEAGVNCMSSTTNLVTVPTIYTKDGTQRIVVAFDYLAKGEGAIIKCLHTGSSILSVDGTVKGAQAISRIKTLDFAGHILAGLWGLLFSFLATAMFFAFRDGSYFQKGGVNLLVTHSINMAGIMVFFISAIVASEKRSKKRTGGKLDEIFEKGFSTKDSDDKASKGVTTGPEMIAKVKESLKSIT